MARRIYERQKVDTERDPRGPEGEDMALTILHTADWHLGRRFAWLPPEQELRLTRARLDVVGKILDLAEHRNVDAVLVAGDIFDGPTPDDQWWQGLQTEFRRRNWVRPVVLLPGNHDPLMPRSVFAADHPFRLSLPKYVHVVDRDDFSLSIGDKAVILSTPCRSHSGQSNLVSSLPDRASGDERFRIGLIHGQTFDMAGFQTNFPIERGAAEARGLDYLALGDTHGFRDVESDSRVPTVYPGAPETTTFGEADTGQVALVFFPRDRRRRALVQAERVGMWKWRDMVCDSIVGLRALLKDAGLRQTVLRLKVEMTVPLEEYDEAGRILHELRGSLAANPRVGVLTEDLSGLRLRIDASLSFPRDLPPVLKGVVERLKAAAMEDPVIGERALHHLYSLVRDSR
jgi:DNA repair exonuclease SbcCD nuclease subunit